MKKQNFSKVAANVLDSTRKDNTLKTIEQIKNDVIWLEKTCLWFGMFSRFYLAFFEKYGVEIQFV